MSIEAMVCKNCQRRAAVGKTTYREVISYQYTSPYVINRGHMARVVSAEQSPAVKFISALSAQETIIGRPSCA